MRLDDSADYIQWYFNHLVLDYYNNLYLFEAPFDPYTTTVSLIQE